MLFSTCKQRRVKQSKCSQALAKIPYACITNFGKRSQALSLMNMSQFHSALNSPADNKDKSCENKTGAYFFRYTVYINGRYFTFIGTYYLLNFCQMYFLPLKSFFRGKKKKKFPWKKDNTQVALWMVNYSKIKLKKSPQKQP